MFRISFMVEDKHLAKTLRTLIPLRVEELKQEPVVNAEVKDGRVTEAGGPKTGPEIVALAIKRAINSENGGVVTRSAVRDLAVANGVSPGASITAIAKAKGDGQLRPTKRRGEYKVNRRAV